MKNDDFKLTASFIKDSVRIFKPIFTVLCESFKKRAAFAGSAKNLQTGNNSGGSIECNYKKCTGCGLCMEVCPALNALIIKEDDDGLKKLVNIDISKCVFCKNCFYVCPNNALNITKQYKLATNNKKDLILDCKEIYKASLQEPQNTAESLDVPAFVNEEEI